MAIQAWDKGLREENEALKQQLMIANRDQFIKDNHIMLPFKVKEAETDYLYEDGPEVEHRDIQAISPKDKRKAFDKFVIDWRKQNGLEGTKVMPPKDVIPFWIRAKGKRDDMTIAGGQYRMDKEGHAEVWKFGPKNYHYNPMPKSYYDLIESVKGMNFKKADIKDSLKRENVGGTIRDLTLPLAIDAYGKTPSGGYKNPGALLSIMKKLV